MKNDPGFAQIIVVSALATVAALLIVALPSASSANRRAAALERLARVDVATTSAFRRATAALSSEGDDLERRALVGPIVLPLGDLSVELEAEAGKIDVVLTDLALFDRLARDADPGDRRALLDRLAAARENGDASRALELARTHLSPSLDEFDRIVTMHGTAQIDVLSAPHKVLAVIPDLTPTQVALIDATPSAERAQFVGLSRYFTTGGRRFSIVARIEWAPGEVSVRRLPIELSTSGQPIVLGGPY